MDLPLTRGPDMPVPAPSGSKPTGPDKCHGRGTGSVALLNLIAGSLLSYMCERGL